jgi:hypothetical protein
MNPSSDAVFIESSGADVAIHRYILDVAQPLAQMVKRAAIFVHRWLGIVLCVLFLIWFPSGIGMMYWDFPSVSPADRLERSPALDPATIRLSPTEAWATLQRTEAPTDVRLDTFDGRPVYHFENIFGETDMVYADSGEPRGGISSAMMLRIASGWSRQPAADASVIEMQDVDQWTVQGLRGRPVWKYSWPSGDQVYLSQATGEVVQYTTTASRMGAYLGPVTHWIYFTPIRKHVPEWSTFVIWTSGIGTAAALLGVAIGLSMYSPRKRYRSAGGPTAIPYRGQKRLHMVFGLIFGVAAATWAFSGMLTMDPFPLDNDPSDSEVTIGAAIEQALRGRTELGAFAAKDPRAALAQLAGHSVKQLELATIAGEPLYMATLAGGEIRHVPLDGAPRAEFDRQRIVDVVTKAAQPAGVSEVRVIDQYDRYYLDRRRERPLPVILARVNDEGGSRYYIDPKTARIVGTHNARNWFSRWVYHALHSFDFPWLYNYRPAWDIVVILFMLGGTVLAFTSLLLAWRALGRTLGRAFAGGVTNRAPVVNDDLMIGAE